MALSSKSLKEMQERGTKDAEDIPYQYLTVEERKRIWGERQYDKYEKKMETNTGNFVDLCVVIGSSGLYVR